MNPKRHMADMASDMLDGNIISNRMLFMTSRDKEIYASLFMYCSVASDKEAVLRRNVDVLILGREWEPTGKADPMPWIATSLIDPDNFTDLPKRMPVPEYVAGPIELVEDYLSDAGLQDLYLAVGSKGQLHLRFVARLLSGDYIMVDCPADDRRVWTPTFIFADTTAGEEDAFVSRAHIAMAYDFDAACSRAKAAARSIDATLSALVDTKPWFDRALV